MRQTSVSARGSEGPDLFRVKEGPRKALTSDFPAQDIFGLSQEYRRVPQSLVGDQGMIDLPSEWLAEWRRSPASRRACW
jgi:hypothetical protein